MMELTMKSLIGISPGTVLVHGDSKRLVDKYHWHVPDVGIVASYSPKEHDVADHFGFFRGVDIIESFAQATTGSCSAYLECKKMQCSFDHLKVTFTPLFLNLGQVNFMNYLELGDTLVCMGQVKFYKFRQMTCDGRVYKAPGGLDLEIYFKDYTEERFLKYDLDESFTLVAELFDVTGKGFRKNKIKY